MFPQGLLKRIMVMAAFLAGVAGASLPPAGASGTPAAPADAAAPAPAAARVLSPAASPLPPPPAPRAASPAPSRAARAAAADAGLLHARGPLAGRTIVVDPGHGGRDPGTQGPGGVEEKALTLAMARHLKAVLEAAGARVVLTREDDRFVGLYERAAVADAAGADAFVSIHVNASDYRSIRGVETYHYPGAPLGTKLAQAVQRRLVEATRRPDRGVHAEDFVVVREPRVPAILVETGYLTNPGEAAVIVTAKHRRGVAEGVARGIADFFGVGEL